MELYSQSWKNVIKFFRKFKHELIYINDLVEKILKSRLSKELHATTSHLCLNISMSHRYDSKNDTIRVVETEEGLVVEYFSYDNLSKNFIITNIYKKASVNEVYDYIKCINKKWKFNSK